MKKSFANYKFPLLIIVYGAICMILIRQSMNSSLVLFKNSKNVVLGSIATSYIDENRLSNDLARNKSISPSTNTLYHNTNTNTLSRGYNDTLEKIPVAIIGSTSNEDELFYLCEDHKINGYALKKSKIISSETSSKDKQLINVHLPDYIMYKAVNISNLKDFLKSRNSILAEEPYLSTIIAVSKDFNLNPLVMFAITGQEQSFVPKDSKNAIEIANNPFNVFNSWRKYNTSIEDTSTIAARTIVNLSKNRPIDMDVFTWVNRKYSEDQGWSKAVRSIFKQLENNVAYCK